ncbi:hypothetical protein OG596_37715 [Streptomyces sp. NBC_01102]|uniref:hypothetical protein n=1 Tax=unclassified Streptomyces TaxID=2593676 RepID=UPI00386CAE8B|nr:hypothetical protein OG596_00205 [Streptomyces sp. NBC_01102]WSU70696.1 hypothetical protein OG596_37715 [Streptomyces sp. NBC_01102]
MKVRFGASRWKTLAVTALAALAASTAPGAVSATAATRVGESEHWGVIAANTIGSPVAALRDGPFGSYQVQGNSAASPPYGKGSLGIQVADKSTSQSSPAEKVDFGNEIDFRGDRLLQLERPASMSFRPPRTSTTAVRATCRASGSRSTPT